MYQKTLIIIIRAFVLFLFLIPSLSSKSQFSLSGQLRTRSEYRNGTGSLKPVNNSAAFFTSQRARINFNYISNKVIFQASVQDVRVWGQDASTISNADGARLGVHEAWAEILLSNKQDSSFKNSPVDYFSIRTGRQELIYDDSRLLGNLDWLQQARRHDAIVLKLHEKGWQADLGAAFNQNTDAFNYNGTFYTPANLPAVIKDSKGNLVPLPAGLMPLANTAGLSAKSGTPMFTNPPSTNGLNQNYKAMQFLYASKKFGQTKISGLFLSDQFGKYKLDSVSTFAGTDSGYVYGRRFNQKGVNTRFTTGVLVNNLLDSKRLWSLQAGAYYQGGKDRDGLSLSAFTTTAALGFTGKKFTYTAGLDYLSGNDAFSASTSNHRFDPLYGTPHKFWGYMDYFYAGTGAPSGGLSNSFLKIKYGSLNKRLAVGVDYHYFALAQNQKDNSSNSVKKYLGSEFDLLATYNLNKMTALEWGFSYLAATPSMEYAKNLAPGSSKLDATWSYLQVNIKPDFFSK